MSPTREEIAEHYHRAGLLNIILDGLYASGKKLDALQPADLAPVDQFHIGGRDATIELAQRAGISTHTSVVDVGGGIGGAARTLVAEYGCHVTVVDISETFCRTGTALTERLGMSDRVAFLHGDALDLPFDDGTFDLVWSQHSTMNILDKPALYTELYRVLRPGGRYAFHEILAGPVQPIHFPVPWAADPSINALATAEDTRAHLAAAGFREVSWTDVSAASLAFFEARVAAMQADGPPPLGLHLLVGPIFGEMAANLVRNLRENRNQVAQGVVERPRA
jgi:SAM-dependent methyltransferase